MNVVNQKITKQRTTIELEPEDITALDNAHRTLQSLLEMDLSDIVTSDQYKDLRFTRQLLQQLLGVTFR